MMKSPMASMSFSKPWNSSSCSRSAAREKPVLTGSTKTRSAMSRSVSLLSTISKGGLGAEPSAFILQRLGPKAPMCSQMEEEPGPPL